MDSNGRLSFSNGVKKVSTQAEREYFKAKRVKDEKVLSDQEIDLASFPQSNLYLSPKVMDDETDFCQLLGAHNPKICKTDLCRPFRLGNCKGGNF